MTTAIEGFFLKSLLLPFSIISLFVMIVILITALLIRRELSDEKEI